MPIFILTLLTRAGVPSRWAATVAAFIAIVLVALGTWAVIAHRDARMIETHDARTDATIATQARNADQAADTAAAPREAAHAQDAATDKEIIRNATQAHPVETARPSGPAVTSVTDELRRRRGTSSVR